MFFLHFRWKNINRGDASLSYCINLSINLNLCVKVVWIIFIYALFYILIFVEFILNAQLKQERLIYQTTKTAAAFSAALMKLIILVMLCSALNYDDE